MFLKKLLLCAISLLFCVIRLEAFPGGEKNNDRFRKPVTGEKIEETPRRLSEGNNFPINQNRQPSPPVIEEYPQDYVDIEGGNLQGTPHVDTGIMISLEHFRHFAEVNPDDYVYIEGDEVNGYTLQKTSFPLSLEEASNKKATQALSNALKEKFCDDIVESVFHELCLDEFGRPLRSASIIEVIDKVENNVNKLIFKTVEYPDENMFVFSERPFNFTDSDFQKKIDITQAELDKIRKSFDEHLQILAQQAPLLEGHLNADDLLEYPEQTEKTLHKTIDTLYPTETPEYPNFLQKIIGFFNVSPNSVTIKEFLDVIIGKAKDYKALQQKLRIQNKVRNDLVPFSNILYERAKADSDKNYGGEKFLHVLDEYNKLFKIFNFCAKSYENESIVLGELKVNEKDCQIIQGASWLKVAKSIAEKKGTECLLRKRLAQKIDRYLAIRKNINALNQGSSYIEYLELLSGLALKSAEIEALQINFMEEERQASKGLKMGEKALQNIEYVFVLYDHVKVKPLYIKRSNTWKTSNEEWVKFASVARLFLKSAEAEVLRLNLIKKQAVVPSDDFETRDLLKRAIEDIGNYILYHNNSARLLEQGKKCVEQLKFAEPLLGSVNARYLKINLDTIKATSAEIRYLKKDAYKAIQHAIDSYNRIVREKIMPCEFGDRNYKLAECFLQKFEAIVLKTKWMSDLERANVDAKNDIIRKISHAIKFYDNLSLKFHPDLYHQEKILNLFEAGRLILESLKATELKLSFEKKLKNYTLENSSVEQKAIQRIEDAIAGYDQASKLYEERAETLDELNKQKKSSESPISLSDKADELVKSFKEIEKNISARISTIDPF